jgi:hypothetical protein
MGYMLSANCEACGFADSVTFGPTLEGANSFMVPVLDVKKKSLTSMNLFNITKKGTKTFDPFELRKFNKNLVPYTSPELTHNTDEELFQHGSDNKELFIYKFRISIVKNKCPKCGKFQMDFSFLGFSD